MTLKEEIEKIINKMVGAEIINGIACPTNQDNTSQAIIDLLISKLPEERKCAGCGGVYYLNDKRLKGKRDCCPDGKYEDKCYNQFRSELLKLYKGE